MVLLILQSPKSNAEFPVPPPKKGTNLISDLPLKIDFLFFRIAFELIQGGLCKYLHLIRLL